MPTISYKTFGVDEAAKNDYPGISDYDTADAFEYEHGIWRCEDGTPVALLAIDGGEPEDNSFTRDGAWIAPALQAAYDLGRKHGHDDVMLHP